MSAEPAAPEHPVTALRRARGMSVADLAEAAGLSPEGVALVEGSVSRMPRGASLTQLASALDVKAADLELAIVQFNQSADRKAAA